MTPILVFTSATDAGAIATLLRACWAATYDSFLSEDTLAMIALEWHHPDVLRRQIANPKVVFLLARTESGTLVGAATAKQVADGTILSIQRLYVHPSYQRQGIGSQLLRDVLAAFPHAQRLELEVAEANLQGRAFWTKHGFHESGRTQASVGEITLHMVAMEREVAA
ncbi:MAG: GNAT family N-acetyltransferase [Gemmatimonadales bacterium]